MSQEQSKTIQYKYDSFLRDTIIIYIIMGVNSLAKLKN